jgi:NDP-sugar pyrophosphorylase family protein
MLSDPTVGLRMSTYKVCILSAGKGIRMGELTQNINKSLLPIQEKAIISHIIDKFDDSIEIVVAVGHEGEKVEEYLSHAHPHRSIKIVNVKHCEGPGSGPGRSLLECEPELQCPFIIFAGDTLVQERIPSPDRNWLGVSFLDEDEDISRFCSAEIKEGKISSLTDKKQCNNNHVFIGLAAVNSYRQFWAALKENDSLVNNELQISNGLLKLINFDLYPERFTWLDTGTRESYFAAREKMEGNQDTFNFDKINEFTYLFGGRLIKYFGDSEKVSSRCKRAESLKGLCPPIEKQTTSFFSYKLLKGETVYECLTPEIASNFFAWCKDYLWSRKTLDSKETSAFKSSCKKFYKEKTYSRVEAYRKKYPNDPEKNDVINDTDVPSLSTLLEKVDWDKLTDGIPVGYHGDLQFDNVLKTGWKSDGKEDFKLIDWRQDFGGLVTHGDLYYDLAKMYGGMTLPYNLIKKNKFNLRKDPEGKIYYDIQSSYKILESQDRFREFVEKEGYDFNKIKLIRAIIFLNMSPLHEPPFDKLLHYASRYHLNLALKDED